MRENFRYILAQIIPGVPYESRDIYRAVAESVMSLYGDSTSAQMWPSVIQIHDQQVIIRCRRGQEKNLETALSAITAIQGTPAAVHPVKTSGTIRALSKYIQKNSETRQGTATVKGKNFEVLVSRRGRIDLKEKGIYLEIPRYITEEDTEDLNYDE